MVERSDVAHPFSLNKLQRLGRTRIAGARQAVADAQRLTQKYRGEFGAK